MKTKSTRSIKQGVIGLKSGNATRFNEGNLGIARDGDNYILYNFDTNIRSRLMTKEEVSTYIREYAESKNHFAETNGQSDVNTENGGYELSENTNAYTEKEIESIIKGEKNSIAKTFSDVLTFISDSIGGKGTKRLFLGKFKTNTASMVKIETDVSIYGKSLVLASDEIRHLFNQHGNVKNELLRGQEAISTDNFNKVVDAVLKPDSVTSSIDNSGTVTLVFEKESDGKTTAVTIVSEKKKALTLKSAWITKKGQHISPPSDVQAPNQTSNSELSMNAVPMNSISQPAEKINSSEKKTSVEVESVDSWARENIPDYAALPSSAKMMIRKVIRQARANGLSEADVKMWADMSAHSGIDVAFDKSLSKTKVKVKQKDGTVKEKIKFVNAYYDEKNNRIVANPEARISQEKALFHELDHALRAFYKKKGINIALKYKKALDNIDEDTEAQIKKEYGDDQAIIDDETTAFYAAEIMATKGYAKALAKEQPSIMKRILSFFKEASNYKNERLSRAAKSYYKLYQKMYAEFSAANRGNNALGGVEGSKRYSLNIKYTDGSVEVLANARTLTNEQAVNYLKKAKAGQIRRNSYIPVRKDTPKVIIDTLYYAGETIRDLSLVMQVKKAQQSMKTKNMDNRVGKKC